MKRLPAAILCSALACVLAPVGAQAATAPSCSGTSALKFTVDRNTFGRTPSLRTIDLRPENGTSASAVKPISVTVIRNGRTRTLHFADLEDQYVYKAKRGEQARFLAVYLEDNSGYGAIGLGQQQTVTVALPGFNVLDPLLGRLFPGGTISVLLPAPITGNAYGSNVCARTLPLTVGEATAARKARTRRSF